MCPAASSRWCPTPDQLMILEELYSTGIRTPNASQIQHITTQLSFYGKIEGKNVFYWFQNHKARDRQKLRRKLSQQQQQEQQLYNHRHHRHQLQQNHLHYFEPPAACAFHQLSHHNSPSFLPQEGELEDAAGARATDYTWKLDIPEIRETSENSVMMHEHDWMTLMNVSSLPIQFSSTSTPTTRPLKTLELFPVTATNLKEECDKSKLSFSCSHTN